VSDCTGMFFLLPVAAAGWQQQRLQQSRAGWQWLQYELATPLLLELCRLL
jgi:hypothetical protein